MRDLSESAQRICNLTQEMKLDVEEAVFVLSSVTHAIIKANVPKEDQGLAYWTVIKNFANDPVEVTYDA